MDEKGKNWQADKMQIKNLRIENYKLFQNLELVFDGRRTILFGINGSGKSAVLSAITQLFRVFLKQMNPAQSKAFESLQDEMIHIDGDRLEIQATVALEEEYLLSRFYRRTVKNTRTSEATYPKADYAKFRENFRKLYLADELSGMPVFVCYGTNRAVPDIPDRIRTTHQYDQLSALERAADPKTDFRAFFEWFMDREADEILRMKDAEDYEYTDPALQCVRKAIESVMGDVKGLRVKRSPVRMVVDKGGREIRVDLLSEGEKCTLAMIGDLARRLILANPAMENPLEGKGIVLIDEIELHMHPSWQRRILSILKEVFPNIQFIVTTHSPQVLGEADESFKIISLSLDMDENGVGIDQIERMDGFDSNMIAGVFIRHSRMLKNDEDHA